MKAYQKPIICLVAAVVVEFALTIAGTLLLASRVPQSTADTICLACAVVLLAALLANTVVYLRNLKNPGRDRETVQAMSQLRDNAALRPLLRKKLLRRLFLLDCYTALSLILAVAVCLMQGVAGKNYTFALPCIAVFQSVLQRFCRKRDKLPAEGNVSREDFPQLYALAEKAQRAVGGDRKIVIYLSSQCTAAISLVGNQAGLLLGCMLLDICTQDEVYQIMLHEFGHLCHKKEHRLEQRSRYYGEGFWYNFMDELCARLHMYYMIFSSQEKEQRADRAVAEQGNPQTAANALAKLAYFDYYDGDFLTSGKMLNLYEQEEMPKDWIALRCQDFKAAMAAQGERARYILDHELPPRVSSHPIMRHRIQALGVSGVVTVFPDHDDAWGAEVHEAICRVNGEISQEMAETYAQRREDIHVKPLANLEAWIASGRPLTYEATREVVETLFAYQRYEELLALARDFRETGASEHERCHVIFYEGLTRLRLRDDEGIDLLYRAIEINGNYESEGMGAIASYCAIWGKEAEMERYRSYADEKVDTNLDIRPLYPLRPKDDICPCEWDDGIFQGNLQVILDAGREELNRVFLVKKNTSPRTYQYIYILEFREGVADDRQDAIYDAIFMHLDKQEEHYALCLFEEASGKGWLEKKPEYLLYQHP